MVYEITSFETDFLVKLVLSLVCGVIIGVERELRRKPACVSTQTLVIGSSTIFTILSQDILYGDPSRVAAQIVSGVGFLGAGIIFKSEQSSRVVNLTTAASIWYAAAIGMTIGYGHFLMAVVATLYAVLISRIPRIRRK